MPARTDIPNGSTVTAIAIQPHLVDLAIVPAEWDDAVGILALLQRDAPSNTYFQRSAELQGAFMGVDDGVGDDHPISVMLSDADESQPMPRPTMSTPAANPTMPAPAPSPRAAGESQPVSDDAQRQAERQARREAEREAERQVQRRAERQAEREAERRADRRVERRSERSRAGAWNNAPHVTWYGPGFYGNRTACGQRYTREIIGVAHKTLPCGTMVEFRWNGITARAPVIDRGPYGPAGYIFDFSAALSCDVFSPRDVERPCFTRQNVAWRIVSRR